MTTRLFSAAPTNATDAEFRAWGAALSAAIEAVGLVKVPVPGAVAWSTVAAPTVAGAFPAREVFRFDDAMQAVAPVFFAIEYGSASMAQACALRVTIGKGVDAAGTITSVMLADIVTGLASGSSAAAHSSTIGQHAVASCGSGACLAVVMNNGAAIWGSPALIIERSRDNTGTPTPAGLTVTAMRHSATSNLPIASVPANPMWAIAYDSGKATLGAVPVVVPYSIDGTVVGGASSLASGVIAPVLPWVAFAPAQAPWQPLACLSYVPGDAVGGSLISVRVLGSDRTYRVIPVDAGHHGWGVPARPYDMTATATLVQSRQAGLMILWED